MHKVRMACYAGLGLLAFGISSLSASAVSKAIFGGILLYLTIGVATLVFGFLLRMLSGGVRQDLKINAQISTGLGVVGCILLMTGVLNFDTLLSQIGVAVILVSLEYFLQERNTAKI